MDAECCVCFQTTVQHEVRTLYDIEDDENNILHDDTFIKSCCGIHIICVRCLRKIAFNFENSAINETSSNIPCPYPFEKCTTSIGFPCVFPHNLIKKICQSQAEWDAYSTFAQQYEFPGYTIVKCPLTLLTSNSVCNAPTLVSNDDIKGLQKGMLVIECNGSPQCWRKYCYWCHSVIGFYRNECYQCLYMHESENPEAFNYYINKFSSLKHITDECSELFFNESDYLYKNKELTPEIVIEQITNLINDIHSFIICPVCKASLYKTEKCNGLSHHGIERCYSCGRIGYKVKGLCDHWNPNGNNGCFRFDNDDLVAKYVPEFFCFAEECSNHDVGDCQVPQHAPGILKLVEFRKKACVYHILKSLSTSLFDTVYDTLFDMFSHDKSLVQFLPFKQTFVMLKKFKDRCQDYIEEIVYINCDLLFPSSLSFFTNKKCTMSADDYVTHYATRHENSYGQFDGLSSEDTLLIRSSTSQMLQRLFQNLSAEIQAPPPPPPLAITPNACVSPPLKPVPSLPTVGNPYVPPPEPFGPTLTLYVTPL